MHTTRTLLTVAGAALVLGSGVAVADTMHPRLAARLAGMGEHGIVNLQSANGRLCWTFDVPTQGIAGASIRDAPGLVVAKLGSSYKAKSCTSLTTKALGLIDAKPKTYWVWLHTKGHPGDLRGRL